MSIDIPVGPAETKWIQPSRIPDFHSLAAAYVWHASLSLMLAERVLLNIAKQGTGLYGASSIYEVFRKVS